MVDKGERRTSDTLFGNFDRVWAMKAILSIMLTRLRIQPIDEYKCLFVYNFILFLFLLYNSRT